MHRNNFDLHDSYNTSIVYIRLKLPVINAYNNSGLLALCIISTLDYTSGSLASSETNISSRSSTLGGSEGSSLIGSGVATAGFDI